SQTNVETMNSSAHIWLPPAPQRWNWLKLHACPGLDELSESNCTSRRLPMSLVRRSWLVILMTLFVGAGTGFAQGRVQLAQGRRAIQDKVSFVVDITRDKRDTRTADSPDDM